MTSIEPQAGGIAAKLCGLHTWKPQANTAQSTEEQIEQNTCKQMIEASKSLTTSKQKRRGWTRECRRRRFEQELSSEV
eukprot:2038707-Amphidinium_carterae.1